MQLVISTTKLKVTSVENKGRKLLLKKVVIVIEKLQKAKNALRNIQIPWYFRATEKKSLFNALTNNWSSENQQQNYLANANLRKSLIVYEPLKTCQWDLHHTQTLCITAKQEGLYYLSLISNHW